MQNTKTMQNNNPFVIESSLQQISSRGRGWLFSVWFHLHLLHISRKCRLAGLLCPPYHSCTVLVSAHFHFVAKKPPQQTNFLYRMWGGHQHSREFFCLFCVLKGSSGKKNAKPGGDQPSGRSRPDPVLLQSSNKQELGFCSSGTQHKFWEAFQTTENRWSDCGGVYWILMNIYSAIQSLYDKAHSL